MLLHLTTTSLDPHSDGLPSKVTFAKSEIVIGRLPTCDLPLADSTISATHAKLSVVKDPINGTPKVYIEDLGSSNGTSVEQIRLSPYTRMAVDADQWIRTGQYIIKVVLDDKSPEEKESSISFDASSGIERFLNGHHTLTPSLYSLTDLANEENEMIDDVEEEKEEAKEQEKDLIEPVFRGTLTNHDLTGLDFEAYKLVMLQGVVLHPDGTPIQGVEVNGGVLGTTQTSEDGRFFFGPMREGTTYEIKASIAGFKFGISTLQGQAIENETLEFRAMKTYSISGRVLREGQPLSEVEIDAGQYGIVKTDGEGRYLISGIPADTEVILRASKQGYGFGKQIVHVTQ